jgi:iron complex outermembrane receptor protein
MFGYARLVKFGLAVLPAITPLAFAQSEDVQNEPVLEELIVTATRRSSDLQTTASAATVLTGELMEKKAVFDLVQLQFASPGISIGDYGSANTFNMRGIGRSQVDIEIPAGIQLYRDKVPMFAGYFQNEPYFDMAGVEVLRGPQGTLAGKSAAGGAVFFRTEDARLDVQEGFLEGGIGNFDAWNLTGMINVPVTDTLAVRLAGTHVEQNDYWFESITGEYTGDPDTRNLNAGRLSVTWTPTPQFTVKGKYDLNYLDFGGNSTTDYGEDPLRPSPCCGVDFEYIDRAKRAILDLEYEFDNGLILTSVSGYQFSDTVNNRSNNSGIGPYDFDPVADAEIGFLSQGDFTLYSQEFNLLSPEGDRFNWVTGVFYQRIESKIYPYPVNGFNLTFLELGATYPFIYSPWDNIEDDISIFGNISYDLTEALELEAGARLSHYTRDQTVDFHVSADNGFTQPPLIPIGADQKSISEDAVDFKVGLNWYLQNDHFLYGFIAKGHTVGGIALGPPWPTFEPVDVYDLEGGWKATWLDGHVQTQFGAYYQQLEDFQGVFASPNDVLGSTIRNAEGTSTIYGVEFSAQAQFGQFAFDFAGSWNVTELGTFGDVVIPLQLLQWFPGAAPGDTVNLSKRESPYSPEFTVSVGAEYALEVGDTMIVPRIDFAYIDDQKDGLYDIPILELESRELVNLQVSFEHGAWYGRVYADNLFDEIYIGGIQALGQLRYLGQPRSYGVRVGRRFGY